MHKCLIWNPNISVLIEYKNNNSNWSKHRLPSNISNIAYNGRCVRDMSRFALVKKNQRKCDLSRSILQNFRANKRGTTREGDVCEEKKRKE